MSVVGLYKSKGRHLPYLVRWLGEIDPATGKAKRYSKSFRTKAEADEFRVKKQQEIRRTGRRDRPTDESFRKVAQDFLSMKKSTVRPKSLELYKLTIDRLLLHFGPETKIASVTPRQADLFMSAQLRQDGKPLEAWSKAQIVTHCRHFYATAIRWGLATSNPFAGVQKARPTEKKWHCLMPDEYERLLDACPDLRRKALYALLYTTGGRIGEVLNLLWGDIDFETGTVRFENRVGTATLPPFNLKDREPRTVPVPKATLRILMEWQAEAPEGVPFICLTADRYERVLAHWRKTGKSDSKWLARLMGNNILRDFKVHARRAQLKFDGRFTIHCFRKSYGQHLARLGTPIKTVQHLMGHAKEETTLKFYAQLDRGSMEAVSSTLDAMLRTPNPNQTDAHLTREGVSGAESTGESERL